MEIFATKIWIPSLHLEIVRPMAPVCQIELFGLAVVYQHHLDAFGQHNVIKLYVIVDVPYLVEIFDTLD